MKKGKPSKTVRKRMREMILTAIEQTGETVRAIAERSGVDQSQLSRFVRGERDLRLESVQKLCDALGLYLESDNPD